MTGRYDEYPDPPRERPGYQARPDGQRQGAVPRGPRQPNPGQPQPGQHGQPQPGQPYPGQPYPGQPQPGQPYPGSRQAPRRQPPPPQGPPVRGPQQQGPQQQGPPVRGGGQGWDDDAFLPGWDGDNGGRDGNGRGRGRMRGAQQQVRDRDDLFEGDPYDQDPYGADPYGADRYDADRYDEDDARPTRRRRRFRWLAPLVALLVIVTPLGVGGYFGYSFYMSKYHPADYSGQGFGSVLVHVPSGADATTLGPELQRLGVVASSRALVLAAEHSTSTSTLEVGYFKVHMHMQASLAWALLTNPANLVQTLVRFPEGLRTSSIISLLGQHTAISLSGYQAAIKDTAALGLPSYAKGHPEGYLFPATYQVTPNETALQVLRAMVTRYNQEAQTLNLTAAARRVGLTPGQLMIVASLVQAEGGRVSDYPKIARVVYNRLQAHMKLQFDSTVLYGLGKFGTVVTDAEIASQTPYNTFLHAGLPPTPIDNPGQAAIEAALKPTPGNWLYFLGLKNGATEFSANPITG